MARHDDSSDIRQQLSALREEGRQRDAELRSLLETMMQTIDKRFDALELRQLGGQRQPAAEAQKPPSKKTVSIASAVDPKGQAEQPFQQGDVGGPGSGDLKKVEGAGEPEATRALGWGRFTKVVPLEPQDPKDVGVKSREGTSAAVCGRTDGSLAVSTAKPPPTGWRKLSVFTAALVANRKFEMFWICVVAINAAVLGVQVQLNADNPSQDAHEFFRACSAVFFVLFAVELLMRFVACGSLAKMYSCQNPDLGWNVFDTIVVSLCGIDAGLEILALCNVDNTQQLANTRIFRMVRVLRIARGLRILKLVRNVGPLRTLIRCTLNTLQHVFWAVLLLTIMSYIFGLMLCDAVSNWKADALVPTNITLASIDPRLLWFSGLGQTMLTLWWSISAGINYQEAVAALDNIDDGWGWGLAYNVFMALMLLRVLNVMTGVVCQSAIEVTDKEIQNELALVALSKGKDKADKLKQSMQKKLGKIQEGDPDAVEGLMQEQWMNDLMKEMHCQPANDTSAGQDLVAVYFGGNAGENSEDSLETFLAAMEKLKQPAKAIDVAMVKTDIVKLQKRLELQQNAAEEQTASKEPVQQAEACKKGKHAAPEASFEVLEDLR